MMEIPPSQMASIDLPRMVRREGVRRNLTLRPIFPTQANASALAALYLAVIKVWQQADILANYAVTTDGLTIDAPPDQQAVIGEVEREVSQLVLEFSAAMRSWAVRVERWHRGKWASAVKAGTGIELDMILSGDAVATTVEATIAQNVDLVRNVSDQVRSKISGAVFRGYQERRPAREVAREIAEATKLGRKRAIRIAADQNAKLAAALDRDRQAEAGIELYRWRHSGKLHPRPWHKARDGRVYDRATGKQVNQDGSPMAGGETVVPGDRPGEAPWCGCRASAYLPIMAELGI